MGTQSYPSVQLATEGDGQHAVRFAATHHAAVLVHVRRSDAVPGRPEVHHMGHIAAVHPAGVAVRWPHLSRDVREPDRDVACDTRRR